MCLSIVKACLVAFAMLSSVLYAQDVKNPEQDFSVLFEDLRPVAASKELKEKIYTTFGKSEFPVLEKTLARTTVNIPDSLNRMFVLDSLDFVWNATTRSYISDGEAKIVSIRDKPMEKTIKIKMELVRRRTGDEFFIYLYDDKMWYYFEYSAKALYTLSSNEEYDNLLRTEKADKKVVWTKEKEILYTITLCPDSKRDRFLKRVN